MPTYEYRCAACSRDVEVEMGINDDEERVCPACHRPMERLISRSSFVLRGGGWAAEGYRSTKNS